MQATLVAPREPPNFHRTTSQQQEVGGMDDVRTPLEGLSKHSDAFQVRLSDGHQQWVRAPIVCLGVFGGCLASQRTPAPCSTSQG